MKNEKELIIYAYFFIDYEIIPYDFIPKYVDAIINKEDNYPLYFIDLSLSKSLDEQFFILQDVFPSDSRCFKKLSIKCIFNQIKISNISFLKKICILYNINRDRKLPLPEQIREDIYELDDKKDYISNGMYNLKILEQDLNDFFHKYT